MWIKSLDISFVFGLNRPISRLPSVSYIGVCVCVFARGRTCVRACLSACVYVCLRARACVRAVVHACARACMCVRVCMCVCRCVRVRVCICVCKRGVVPASLLRAERETVCQL